MKVAAEASLLSLARRRLGRDPGAVASLVWLGLVAFACLAGPLLGGHDYDKLYYDFVRVPPGLEARPASEAIMPIVARVALRLRAEVSAVALEGDRLRLTLTAPRPIDQRGLVYFERADVFGPPEIVSRDPDGQQLTLVVPIRRLTFPLGTDALGRDLLSRTLVAGRISLSLGLLATAVALMIGVVYGATAGYLGGIPDALMMRVVDILYALPFVFFVIMLVVFFGRNVVLIFIAVGAVEWLDMARIVRGQTLAIRRQDYVLAAEALGVTTPAIIARHVIPNALGPVIVYATLMVPRVILLESFLSFLGLGVQEPMTSWGVLIADGSRSLEVAPWILLVPSAFLVGTLAALMRLGEGLRHALDPRAT